MKFLENTRDLLRTLEHGKPMRIFCPKCGDPEISNSSPFDLWLMPVKYVCQKCGYVGPIAMELEKKEDE